MEIENGLAAFALIHPSRSVDWQCCPKFGAISQPRYANQCRETVTNEIDRTTDALAVLPPLDVTVSKHRPGPNRRQVLIWFRERAASRGRFLVPERKFSAGLFKVLKGFLMQTMAPHFSVKSLVIHSRLLRGWPNSTLILDQQAAKIVLFTIQQILLQ